MNYEEKILKHNIMMRVRLIYGIKSLPRIFAPKLALLASLVAIAGFFVSMPNVLRNMPSILELPKFFEFMTAAFLNTRFVIQLAVVATLVVIFYMVRDIAKTLGLVNRQETSIV